MAISIIRENELNKVIKFLALGFSWSLERSNKVKNYIKKANKDIDFYGFYIFNSDNEINGAVLSPYQGKYFSRGEEIRVANLMSWYVSPNIRGMESIQLAKSAVDYLNKRKYSVVNFTPNNIAITVFLSFGFKYMDILTARFFYFEGFKYFSPFAFKKYVRKIIPVKDIYSSFKENFKSGTKTYKIVLNNNDIIFKAVKTTRKKKILGLNIFLPVLYITPLIKKEYVLENIEIFSSALCYYFLVLFIELDIEKKYLISNNDFHKRFKPRYLCFSKEKNFKVIPFFGSELTIK